MIELIPDGALKASARFGGIDSYRSMWIERDFRRCIALYRLLELERKCTVHWTYIMSNHFHLRYIFHLPLMTKDGQLKILTNTSHHITSLISNSLLHCQWLWLDCFPLKKLNLPISWLNSSLRFHWTNKKNM